jgi:hypothetical protein
MRGRRIQDRSGLKRSSPGTKNRLQRPWLIKAAKVAPRRFLRKEVIQPQVPLRLPCYDFTPVADLTVAGCLLRG